MEERFTKAERTAWLGIGANLFLVTIKAIVGYLAGSRALLADAVNSASDVMGSTAVLIGLRVAKQPPDSDHPYGHGKAESIAAIIVSVLLFVVGLEIAFTSFKMFFAPIAAPEIWAIYVVVFTVLLKEFLYRYQLRLGRKLQSQALIANALDHRSDVYASLAALLGIGGSILGERLGISYLVYLDPVAGIAVSLVVLRTAYQMISESIHNTLDHVLHDEDAQELKEAAENVDGVLRIDDLRAREHGHYVIIDIKVSVDPEITVIQGHAIGKKVKETLIGQFPHVNDVLVHINPYDPHYANSHQMRKNGGNSDMIN